MITKRFEPTFSEEDVKAALRGSEEVSGEVKRGLSAASWKQRGMVVAVAVFLGLVGLGMLVWGLFGIGDTINPLWRLIMIGAGAGFVVLFPGWGLFELGHSFTRGSRKEPEPLLRSFLNDVICRRMVDPDYSRALKLVSPAVMRISTLENASNAWADLVKRIKGEVGSQETALCVSCGREKSGLWSVWPYEPYGQDDVYIRNNKLRFFRCGSCDAVICGLCYLELEKEGLLKKRRCPECGENLDEAKPIFFTKPELEWEAGVRDISVEEEAAGRVARMNGTVRAECKLVEKIDKGSGERKHTRPLDERGRVTLHFQNTAVKVGEEWFLVGATPGREVSTRTDTA